MAKKKNKKSADVEDDDWFDDDDWDDDPKPKKTKKKGSKGKGNTGKAVAWVIAFIVILAILLFIRFKYTAPVGDSDTSEEEDTELDFEDIEMVVPDEKDVSEEDEGSEYEEPKYIGPDVIEREDLPKVQEVIDTTSEPELFSNIRCDYDYTSELLYISLRMYNTLDEDMMISPRGVQKGYNTYFKIRGVVDTDPGCGTEVLMPGEYTECDKIGFDNLRYGNVEGVNRISVQVPGRTEALLVECPGMPSGSSEEE